MISKGIDLLIDGKIYKVKAMFTDKESIEINVLSNLNRYVQKGFLNLNVYLENNTDGEANTERFEAIEMAIMPLLVENNFLNIRFQLEQQSGIMADMEHDKYHFINYKFNFQTI